MRHVIQDGSIGVELQGQAQKNPVESVLFCQSMLGRFLIVAATETDVGVDVYRAVLETVTVFDPFGKDAGEEDDVVADMRMNQELATAVDALCLLD